jgi:hypothetical protein
MHRREFLSNAGAVAAVVLAAPAASAVAAEKAARFVALCRSDGQIWLTKHRGGGLDYVVLPGRSFRAEIAAAEDAMQGDRAAVVDHLLAEIAEDFDSDTGFEVI